MSFVLLHQVCASPKFYNITAVHNLPAFIAPIHTGYQLAIDDINNNPTILPNTTLLLQKLFPDTDADMMRTMIELREEQDVTFICGTELDEPAIPSGIVGSVYGIAQLSATVTSAAISDSDTYPYFTRVIGSSIGQINALIAQLNYYDELSGPGYKDVAIITSSTNSYGLELAEFSVLTYQQYLIGEGFDVELQEVKNSGARVILIFIYAQDNFEELMLAANDYGLVGENYVWGTTDALVGSAVFADLNPEVLALSRGMLGTFEFFPNEGSIYEEFITRWTTADSDVYPGAGPGTFPKPFPTLIYDTMYIAALAIQEMDNQGRLDSGEFISAADWSSILQSIKYEGVTGNIEFEANGDRKSTFSINYYDPDALAWQLSAKWFEEDGIEPLNDVIWFSNTTEIPDLDIRPPFAYWSCNERKEKIDPKKQSVCVLLVVKEVLMRLNHITIATTSLIVGICPMKVLIARVILLLSLSFLYKRVRASSPAFMILTLLSIIVGYFSIFAWFGKPHPVSCAFQPWLLGLSAISMIATLSVKMLRIWKIFKHSNQLKRQKITDFQILVVWALIMIPAFCIITLWTIISTPTASMENRDGEDHYVCNTGGFTGEPGGYIFFGILVAYAALVLLFGGVLTIATRNVPSIFNESKLLAASIYNLGFLSVVIIPVYLVVNSFDPFIAWILRTIAILYAFTATLVLQFGPLLFALLFFDHCKNVDVALSKPSSGTGSSSFSNSQT